ncbi:MAG TPA: hypothetical protein VNU20_00805 [Candidatus Sulfotelmatobacter sp.]|jgi:hypothetical protein|nr:hypothetical protein [Candidatus Sulfotelmatobacter sp.]
MARQPTKGPFAPGFILTFCLLLFGLSGLSALNRAQESKATTEKKSPVYPRGLRLMLTDDSYQLVREYQRNGEHVRYYSMERGDWEELPASMVDWNATAKAEAEMEKESKELVEKVHKQEEARRLDNVADIDASLRVGDGAFLPSGEGMFVVEGKTIRILDQAGSAMKTDQKRVIAEVLSPVHVVPGKQTLVMQGAHAAVRLKTNSPEFYLREAPPDPDSTSSIQRSRRVSEAGPDVELVRTKVGRNSRVLESIKTLFGQAVSENINVISMQRWDVAPNVYRFTLSQPLPPGEYVLAEVLEEGLNLYVWDFGLDAAVANTPKQPQTK